MVAIGDIGFQIMILARPEGGIQVRRTYKYVVEDSDPNVQPSRSPKSLSGSLYPRLLRHQGFFPFRADPHLLQNLSSLPIGLPQLRQNFERGCFVPFVGWGMGSGWVAAARYVAIRQTKTMTIIIPPPTTATAGQLIPAPLLNVTGDPGPSTPVLGGARLSADN